MYPTLQHFFGAYYHQDCFEESADADSVLQVYLHDASREDAAATMRELRQLLAERQDEDKLTATLLELGSYYRPAADGLTAQQWLEHLVLLFESKGRGG